MVHEKSPTQHMADLEMLEDSVFGSFNIVFKNKDTEYIHVDGDIDEGPSHAEVQFLWTQRGMSKKSADLW